MIPRTALRAPRRFSTSRAFQASSKYQRSIGATYSFISPISSDHKSLYRHSANLRSEALPTEPFTHEPAVDLYASQPINPVTLQSLIRLSPEKLIANSQYLQLELPVRTAKLVKAMQGLPLIVMSNPHINSVKNLYTDTLTQLAQAEKVNDEKGVHNFCGILRDSVVQLSGVIPVLAQGMVLKNSCYTSAHHANYIP